MPCHLGWPFRGQNNLGLQLSLALLSTLPRISRVIKERPIHIRSHMVPTRHFALLTEYLLPERFCVFFSISRDSCRLFALVKHSPSVCEDKSNFYYIFFICHNLSLVSFCPALLFSSQQRREHVRGTEYRGETMAAGKVAFFCSRLPQRHSHMWPLLAFAPPSSKCIWCSSLWLDIDPPPRLPLSLTQRATPKQVCQRND